MKTILPAGRAWTLAAVQRHWAVSTFNPLGLGLSHSAAATAPRLESAATCLVPPQRPDLLLVAASTLADLPGRGAAARWDTLSES